MSTLEIKWRDWNGVHVSVPERNDRAIALVKVLAKHNEPYGWCRSGDYFILAEREADGSYSVMDALPMRHALDVKVTP